MMPRHGEWDDAIVVDSGRIDDIEDALLIERGLTGRIPTAEEEGCFCHSVCACDDRSDR